ncbi:MAG TPA: GNAT family N-acetyltransferase [Bacteroidetes bacterium]|nr:GNAT family N-acetyltransferase [Bacteroidota bacterium]
MFRIRLAIEADTQAIIDFQMKMALESEGFQLNRETLASGVIAVFRDPQKGKYFVAEHDGEVIASMLLTPEWSDWRNRWVFWLQSVYVLPDYRKKGVFRMMYSHAKKLVEEDNDCAGLRLYVDVDNKNALAVYRALGMNGDHYKVFEWMKG